MIYKARLTEGASQRVQEDTLKFALNNGRSIFRF